MMTAVPAFGSSAVTAGEFAASIENLGPFEPRPRLAVACSGGPDSMALLRLAVDWAVTHGGSSTALVVDHGLRSGSAEEASAAADWARAHGADAIVLTRRGERPGANVQAVAREARYRLLADWCARNGILHLLLAHHRDDQAETVLLRLARDSGVEGLAAMAPVDELPEVRLLRPLLDVPKSRLRATVAAFGLPHVADPSNDDERFDRVRIRKRTPAFAAAGLDPDHLAATAGGMSKGREMLDRDVAALLARSVELYPEGYLVLDPGPFGAYAAETGKRALARLVAVIGGRLHPPRRERLSRLHERIMTGNLGGGRTLAGCRVLQRGGQVLICRETGTIREVASVEATVIWDGRFRITCHGGGQGLEIRRLGQDGWRQVVRCQPELRETPCPPAVRPSLPAVWGLEQVLEVPHLSFACYARRGIERVVREICFAPLRPLQAIRFTTTCSRSTLDDCGPGEGRRTEGREQRRT